MTATTSNGYQPVEYEPIELEPMPGELVLPTQMQPRPGSRTAAVVQQQADQTQRLGLIGDTGTVAEKAIREVQVNGQQEFITGMEQMFAQLDSTSDPRVRELAEKRLRQDVVNDFAKSITGIQRVLTLAIADVTTEPLKTPDPEGEPKVIEVKVEPKKKGFLQRMLGDGSDA